MADNRQAARPRPDARQPATGDGRLDDLAGYLAGPSNRGERLIYERVRLGIMSALAVNRTVTFSELKKLLDTTDGNLSAHARKLEDVGYVACRKTFAERLPRTEYQITPKGRRAFERYLDHMEALIRATREN